MTTSRKATERFSDRVESYVRYRPGYPGEVVRTLRARGFLPARGVVADVGSGTGISSRLFLDAGQRVYGVEPNLAMRRAAEAELAGVESFESVDGTAEATTLADGSVDLVVAGQAFHWFDPGPTKAEFLRILRPKGAIALFWNRRSPDATPFNASYEAVVRRFALDYVEVSERRVDDATVAAFFGAESEVHVFRNVQELDLAGVRGRLMSSSYMPTSGHPSFDAFREAVVAAFDAHQVDGVVRLEYATQLYVSAVRG